MVVCFIAKHCIDMRAGYTNAYWLEAGLVGKFVFSVLAEPHSAHSPLYENSSGGGATELKLCSSAPDEIKPQSLHLKDSNVSVIIDITKTSSGYRAGL